MIVLVTVNIISQDYLRTVRLAALRKRVWYRVLDRVERGIFNLTIDVVVKVHSSVLAGELVKILAKLRDASKSAFTRHIESYGYKKLRETVKQANALGCEASGWLIDFGFAEWFALNSFYNPAGWRNRV